MTERPFWTLKGEKHLATFPTNALDYDRAAAAFVDQGVFVDRGSDMNDVSKQVASYFLQAAHPALVELACRVRTGTAVPPPWYELDAAGDPERPVPGHEAEIFLSQEGRPGSGWLISIATDGEMTDAAKEEHKHLVAEVRAELEREGFDKAARLTRFLSPGPKYDSEKRLEAFEATASNYRPMAPGDQLDRLRIASICSGIYAPLDVPKGNCDTLARARRAFAEDGYLRGEQLDIPLSSYVRHQDMLEWSSLARMNGSVDIALNLLSDMLVANGLDQMVHSRDAEISTQSWVCYGGTRFAEMMEAANAAMHESRGLVDGDVIDKLADLSARLAAVDMTARLPDLQTLVDLLPGHGHVNAEHQYDGAGSDQYVWIEQDEFCDTIHSETQNGIFTTFLERDPATGEIARVSCEEKNLGKIGRFVMENDKLCADYAGAAPADRIPYKIELVRSMNDLVSNLASLSCCLEDDYSVDEDSLEP